MSRPGRQEKTRILLRRSKVAKMMARGEDSAVEITAKLGADESQTHTIRRDMEKVRQRWLKKIAKNAEEHAARKLAEIRATRDEAVAAWERSKAPKESTREKRRTGGESGYDETETKNEKRDGDPRFLAIILECDRQERELLIPKDTVAQPPSSVNVNVRALSVQQVLDEDADIITASRVLGEAVVVERPEQPVHLPEANS